MALITWDESLSVGVRAVDDQHKGLVQTLNELHEAMSKGVAREASGPLLEKLAKYARDHFMAEEAMMKRASYPELEAHRGKHVDLTRQVEEYLGRFRSGEIGLSVHLLDFLRKWLTNHIQKEDRAYGPWLNRSGIR
jgi:hemerythrin